MKLHRAAPFLRAYRWLPHRLLNGAALALSRARRPRRVVDAVIHEWIRRGDIDMGDYEERDYACVEEFFLRRLRPGARPLEGDHDTLVSPVDGVVVDAGVLGPDQELLVKGSPISFERLVGMGRDTGDAGGSPRGDAARYDGGQYAVIFLSPDGYHRIHAPRSGTIDQVRSIRGRFFPQNEDALRHIDKIYEKNERAVLRLRTPGPGPATASGELLLVLVGASLVGGIELEHQGRTVWAQRDSMDLSWPVARGEEIAHFRFGSTVVVLLPASTPDRFTIAPGQVVRMGQSIARV